MKRIAICLYSSSDNNKEYATDIVRRKFSKDVNIFYGYDTDLYVALYKSAHNKQSTEIKINKDFDICMAIDTSQIHLLEHTFIVDNMNPFKLYYVKGGFDVSKNVTLVSPVIFYGSSFIFNRVAEFAINRLLINTHWLKDTSLEFQFSYHLRSLLINTECINIENSSLFIRPT